MVGDAAAVALVAQVAEGGAIGQGAVIAHDDNGHVSPAGTFSNGAVIVSAGTPNIVVNTDALETVFNDPAALSPEDVDSNVCRIFVPMASIQMSVFFWCRPP
jgi:hypothetical protein